MYNAHRGMGVPAQPTSRLTELLDQVRTEFDAERSKVAEYEQNRKFARAFYSVCSGLQHALCRGFVAVHALLSQAVHHSSPYVSTITPVVTDHNVTQKAGCANERVTISSGGPNARNGISQAEGVCPGAESAKHEGEVHNSWYVDFW